MIREVNNMECVVVTPAKKFVVDDDDGGDDVDYMTRHYAMHIVIT